MSTNLVRSLIAGSVSAVASLTLLATPAAHAAPAPCTAVLTANGDGTGTLAYPDDCNPGVAPLHGLDYGLLQGTGTPDYIPTHVQPDGCGALDPANLEVRVAQTSPDDWQWRFAINGSTKYLCNDIVTAEMVNLANGDRVQQQFTLFDIVNANTLGSDYVAVFATPCTYTTTAYLGRSLTQLAQYADQAKGTPECNLPIPNKTPDHPRTTDTTVPGEPQLPHTGSDTTTLLVGGALLVVGAGLGFTAMSMTRRRHHA